LDRQSRTGARAPQKHPAAGAVRSCVPEVRRDRPADVRRQRERGSRPALASDGDLSAFPIEIVQLEQRHFARPQSETRE
jgi:hypothetical protein